MSQPLEEMASTSEAWCGRSWEGLVDRRCDALRHAVALRDSTERDSHEVVGEFFEFFDETGAGLFRDEEDWIFRELLPTPTAVLDALQGHIEISSLILALLSEAGAGCVDLRVVHHLGSLLEGHLLLEEEEIRPLMRRRSLLQPAS